MAAAIKEETGVDSALVKGGGGIFDVFVDDELVFSKKREGRFPEEGEILRKLGN